MPAKLYGVPGSHPCAAVQHAFALKDLPLERTDYLPVFHKLAQRARFGAWTVPGVVFDDGAKVVGSRAILRELDRRCPQPPLLPADEQRRRSVEDAEEWGDQVLQPLVRRVLWWALSQNTGAQLSYLEGARLVPPAPRPVARLSGGVVGLAERRINGSTEADVRADLMHLPGHLDRVDRWIGEGVLGGDEVNAADLQIGASLRLLLTVGDLQPDIDARPAGALARRLFPVYPGHVPAGALPAARQP